MEDEGVAPGAAGAYGERGGSGDAAGGEASLASTSPGTGGAAADDDYQFYQAADGQRLFLHPLNVRMLQAAA